LSLSSKTASPETVIAGEPVTYTIRLQNVGPAGEAAGVWVSDALPISLTYVADSLTFPGGRGGYDPIQQVITWTGVVSMDLPTIITFQAVPSTDLPDHSTVINTALILGTDAEPYTRTAAITVLQPPHIAATTPADQDVRVPVTASLAITFNGPVNPGSLAYTVSPDPGGLAAQWSAGNTRLVLLHNAFTYLQTYTVTLAASDPDGLPLAPGPVPNPWQFTTVPTPTFILATLPADSEVGVPLTQTLIITCSQPVITSTFQYTITPDPGGWTVLWNDTATQVSLAHADLAPGQSYTVTVAVMDIYGQPLVVGPAPNPWSFLTRTLWGLFLPVVSK
jgi:uncharacterized repeat protein (TIGR01451 family)